MRKFVSPSKKYIQRTQFEALTLVNKVKSFFGAILLGQVLLTTATPVLADSYSNDYNNYDRSTTTQQAKENTNWSEIAVIGLGSLILLNSLFSGGSGESSNQEQTSDRYYYTDDTSAPSYNSSPAPVEPISPFYGSCHSYDC